MILIYVRKIDNIFMFMDDKLQVLICFVKFLVEVIFNIEYCVESKFKVQVWKNCMEIKFYMYGEINLYFVSYQYMVFLWFMDILCEIYILREIVFLYGEDFV